jgi:hypothetical protein
MAIRVTAGTQVYILAAKLLGEGETARVFPAYLEGHDPSQVDCAVKLPQDERYNDYIEREYKTIKTLRESMGSSTDALLMLPQAEIGKSSDGREALIMNPVLDRSLYNVLEGLTESTAREKLAIEAAKQYTRLLEAMMRSKISCLDRKLRDLWWIGKAESGHLVVTDWNVVDQGVSPIADIRRFGLLWYELMLGRLMKLGFQPRREDFDTIQHKVSYGLWYTIGHAVGSAMGSQFHTIEELEHILDELARLWSRSPLSLVDSAQNDLKAAQINLDRTKADLAWIKFDIAERLQNEKHTGDISQSRLWACDPVSQAAPDLLKRLSSPNFSEVAVQLSDLKNRAQGSHELGEVQRLQWGFDLLDDVKSILIRVGASTEVVSAQQKFTDVQRLLVDNVLRPLMSKNGSAARQGLQRIAELLGPHVEQKLSDILESFRQEASLWEEYQAGQRDQGDYPERAITALKKARKTRELIKHWPASYEPTAEDIEQLKLLVESNARLLDLAGKVADQARQEEIDRFLTQVDHDRAKRRWWEMAVELGAILQKYPGSSTIKEAAERVILDLLGKRSELAKCRPRPRELAERAEIIEALRQIPPGLSPDLATEQELCEELEVIRQVEQKISQGQQDLFRDPDQVLSRAIDEGYELFDDIGLSVLVLKTVHDVGRWGNDKLSKEVGELEQQVGHLAEITSVLAERRDEIREIMPAFEKWKMETPAETSLFLAGMLRLYLSASMTQIKNGENASASLQKAEQLLDHAVQLLSEDEYTTFRNAYQHLVERQANRQIPPDGYDKCSDSVVSVEQLEGWFQERRLEDCANKVDGLLNGGQRNEWKTRINQAIQLRTILKQGGSVLETRDFLQNEKKAQVSVLTTALGTLRSTNEYDQMAYNIYKREIQDLYERIWRKLESLDGKSARRFPVNIRNQS